MKIKEFLYKKELEDEIEVLTKENAELRSIADCPDIFKANERIKELEVKIKKLSYLDESVCLNCGQPQAVRVDCMPKECPWCRAKRLTTQNNLLLAHEDKNAWGIVENLEKKNKELEDEISDYKDTFKTVMDEKCHKDEIHCTCVPYLRKEVKKLEKSFAGSEVYCKHLEDKLHKIREYVYQLVGEHYFDEGMHKRAIKLLKETKE